MDYQRIFDRLLLSDKIVREFKELYYRDKEFKSWLLSRLPQIEDCFKQQQNNPWHIYNVIDHILHSVEEMNKLTLGMPEEERRELAYVMLYHDIGKPAKHITRMKNGQMIDSFYNHNYESAKIVNHTIKNFGVSEETKNKIYKLVLKHDVFLNLCDKDHYDKNKKLITHDYITQLAKEFSDVGDGTLVLRELLMVGRADNMAQNPEMTANSFKLLDVMENMLDEIEGNKEQS